MVTAAFLLDVDAMAGLVIGTHAWLPLIPDTDVIGQTGEMGWTEVGGAFRGQDVIVHPRDTGHIAEWTMTPEQSGPTLNTGAPFCGSYREILQIRWS